MIGVALADLVGAETVARDEVVVCTKGGYLPFDGWEPVDPAAYIRDVYLGPGVFAPEDVVGGCHVMTPRYVADQLARSRRNLGLDHLDVAYLHNPETQLAEVPRREFDARVRAAFSTFEEEVAAGRIGRYGVATWHGLRRSADASDHLSLADLVAAARDVAGDGHHFRVIQLPFNLVMPEAFATPTQEVDGHRLTALAAAEALGIAVMVSAPLLQGQLSLRLPSRMGEAFPGLDTPAQWALQFARSAPGVTTALVGMSGPAHVRDNVAVARVPPAPAGVDSLFTHG